MSASQATTFRSSCSGVFIGGAPPPVNHAAHLAFMCRLPGLRATSLDASSDMS